MRCWTGCRLVTRQHQRVDRQADRQVAADGRIKRDQHALERFGQRGGEGDDLIKDRLAVLGFTDLEIRRVRRGFDEVALRIDMEKPGNVTGNLAAHDQAGAEINTAAAVLSLAFLPDDLAQRLACSPT